MPVVTRMRYPSAVGSTSVTSPVASINPVNISLDQSVGAKPDGDYPAQTRPGGHGRQPVDPGRSETMRSPEDLDAIDQRGVPEGLMEHRPSFHGHGTNPPPGKQLQGGPQHLATTWVRKPGISSYQRHL